MGGCNFPGGLGGVGVGAERGRSRLAFLAGIGEMSCHCWAEWICFFLPHSPTQHGIDSAHSREAGREGRPTPSPINLGGRDSLLELSPAAALPAATGQESRRTALRGETEARLPMLGSPASSSSPSEPQGQAQRKTRTFPPTRIFCMLCTCCCVSFI